MTTPLIRQLGHGIWFILIAAGCQTPLPPPTRISPAPPETLRIGLTGSATTFAGLVQDAFASENEHIWLQFVTANTATLYEDLAGGQLDALLVHHVPADAPYWFNPVALDGLVIVVHPDNPVRDLSLSQIRSVFSGRIDHWALLVGYEEPITILSRERGAGTRLLLAERIMAEHRLSILAQIQPGNQLLLSELTSRRGAVGYTMMGSLEDAAAVAIDGVPATPDTTALQTYPFTVPIYFVNSAAAEPEGAARAFLAWLQSDAAQARIGQKYGRVR